MTQDEGAKGLTGAVQHAFDTAYHDFVVRGVDRSDADLALLESAGLMVSRVLTDDDDYFGLDSLEPGERVYEFSRTGQLLASERRAALTREVSP